MKSALACIIVLLVLAAAGCTAPASPGPLPATPAIPDLRGSWTGPMEGYDQGTGFSLYPDLAVAMIVTEQHGRIFAGNFTFRANGTETRSGFAGAIGRDNLTLTIAEENGGYCTGTVLASGDIELVYMEDGSPYSIAIDMFHRTAEHQNAPAGFPRRE